MKNKLKHLQKQVAVALCVIVAMAFTSCSNDDDPKSTQIVEGEWISADGRIYYQFSSGGTGRYICLADEPGYDPEYPEAAIKKPVDSDYFDYTVEGDVLTMKEYANIQDKDDYTIYVYEFVASKDILQMRRLRTIEDGIEIDESNYSSWETFKRWTASK